MNQKIFQLLCHTAYKPGGGYGHRWYFGRRTGLAGRLIDSADRLKTAHSIETVRTGVPSRWKNPYSGNSYTVIPTKTIETTSGSMQGIYD